MNLASPNDLPLALEERCDHIKHVLAQPAFAALARAPTVLESALRVTLASDFVLRVLSRAPEMLVTRLLDPEPLDATRLAAALDLGTLGEPDAMAKLRRMRNLEMARIAWRDIAGWTDLDATFRDLTLLADNSIRVALAYAQRAAADRTGAALQRADAAPLLILGMGKLGGEELNYSSDIDLVMLQAETDGDADVMQRRGVRVAQTLIRLLDQVTEDGFVFRVDVRLRPFGASGPLVISLGAFESYLVRHGRDWERYAYVKSRLITGREFERELFDETLTPFVYRRYLDYGVFDALRQMKGLIAQEVARRDLADNIKLGPGGIREIEFMAQALQLVRGGRDPALRTRSLEPALRRLAERGDLEPRVVADLTASYRYLRTLENRLQTVDDRQVHELPGSALERAQIAYSLGEPSYEVVCDKLAEHRARVETHFSQFAWERAPASRPVERSAVFAAAWEADTIVEAIESCGLPEAQAIAAQLTELREGPLYQRMDEPSRQRLAGAVARTIPLLGQLPNPAATLARVLGVFAAIGRRSAYLALLNENPEALERLLSLASQSAFIARQIAEHPLLLDELLDARLFESPPSRAEFVQMLERFRAAATEDLESELEAMRQFQRAAVFRIAVADRLGALPLMKVSDRLTDTAELVLELALSIAWRELTAKFGVPMCGDPPALRAAGFAVVGYGKLGGLELGYGSDLDLVFLHDSHGKHQETDAEPPLDNARFYGRLAQRLIHFLSIQTRSGRLYEVDTRLRPSGAAGAMVASLERFGRYQREDAWVWEHQALLRSRSVAGSEHVCARFEQERHDVLVNHVHRDRLLADIASMRQRMRTELSLAKRGEFDIKQDSGGLADIEFLVDYLVLANAHEVPALVEFPDNVRQLEALARSGLLSAERCRILTDSYLALRRRTHELALDNGGRVVPDSEFSDLRGVVTALWEEVFGHAPSGPIMAPASRR
jgi:[glutamine synthetase] adenylyltransferase / [glutamine synthetase]-adenylyl-L-tyrosine phosphorylase